MGNCLRNTMRRILILSLMLVQLGVVACGDGSAGPNAQRLSASEESELRRAQLAIHSYCRRVGLFLTGRRGSPTGADAGRASEAVDVLVALAREMPDATYRGRTLRELLGDTAEDLEGANCSPALVAQLNSALAGLP